MDLVSTSCYIYMWFPSSQVVKDKLGFVGVTERDILPIYHERFLSSHEHQLFWWKKIFGKKTKIQTYLTSKDIKITENKFTIFLLIQMFFFIAVTAIYVLFLHETTLKITLQSHSSVASSFLYSSVLLYLFYYLPLSHFWQFIFFFWSIKVYTTRTSSGKHDLRILIEKFQFWKKHRAAF